MAQENTTLIIGAGSSKEFNLPVGDELKSDIAGLLDIQMDSHNRIHGGDKLIKDALRVHSSRRDPGGGSYKQHLLAARWIVRAMPQAASIDQFIDAHQGNSALELCGKLAIVRSILTAEGKSTITLKSEREPLPDFSQSEKTWLAQLFRLIISGAKVGDLAHRLSSLTLIVFNYDRCIEHYLYCAFQNYFGMDAAEASLLLQRLTIFHPYGTVGSLPWQHVSDGTEISFGQLPDHMRLLDLSQRIRTFTEGTDPNNSSIYNIRNRLADSDRIVFLGFAFHPINLKLLWDNGTPTCDADKTEVLGTSLGLSRSAHNSVINDLGGMARVSTAKVTLNPYTSYEFLVHYGRELSQRMFG
ncbi:MAG: hypothetical protein ACPGJF_07620 [Sinimarinibacterium flocculans]|uniref:hypothetical protein n=1 Tax=Sinimarinibacterium flocculans TaxID=985250 RepID=UPI003C6649B3